MIDRFIPSPVDNTDRYWSDDHKKFIKRAGIISKDGKSVIMNKLAHFPNRDRYNWVTTSNSVYNFATLTADMELTKIADLGKYTEPDYWTRRNTTDYNLYYKDPEKTPKEKLKFVGQNEAVQVCYVTKDGYIGNLAFALLSDNLSFLKHPLPSSIGLPTKYNEN